MKRKIFKGKFTTTLRMNETDVFYEIMTALMRVFDYEKGKIVNLDYIINAKKRLLSVMIGAEAAMFCKITECEKIVFESLTNKKRIMKTYDITEEEWDSMLAFDTELDSEELEKRVYRYEMELTVPEPGYEEYVEIAVNLLKEIC